MKFDDGEYKVIQGASIGIVKGEEREDFWKYASYSEKQFKEFIEASQEFFKDYIDGKDCSEYIIDGAEALYVYEHLGNCVCVVKNEDKYDCTDNGHHRCAVAKKYGLNLLVFVENNFK